MRRSIVKQVEEEYGQPFWDVVRGYASDNYGCDTTAMILGYSSPKGLRELIARHGVTIDWPKHGSCNVQKCRGPYPRERVEAAVEARLSNSKTPAYFYEQRTGESAESMIERLASTHTKTEVAHILGWKLPSGLASWMKTRGISAIFKKVKPVPPRGMGWQATSNRQRESTHHAAQSTL